MVIEKEECRVILKDFFGGIALKYLKIINMREILFIVEYLVLLLVFFCVLYFF